MILLSTMRGTAWASCVDPIDHVVVVNILERAGMRNAQVSPTEPYVEGVQEDEDQESEEVAAATWRDQVEAAHDGTERDHGYDMLATPPRREEPRDRDQETCLLLHPCAEEVLAQPDMAIGQTPVQLTYHLLNSNPSANPY